MYSLNLMFMPDLREGPVLAVRMCIQGVPHNDDS